MVCGLLASKLCSLGLAGFPIGPPTRHQAGGFPLRANLLCYQQYSQITT